MIINKVQATGCVFEMNADGWYDVTTWTRLTGALSAETVLYEGLSWQEAMDVASAHVSGSRPGWAVGDGWQMRPLFGPGSDHD